MSDNPFSPHYKGRLAADMTSAKGRAKAAASARSTAARDALRQSADPHLRLVGRGSIPGLASSPSDPAKAGRIRKPGALG
ncbi:hypothetical protein [Caldimonas thermodepolymerans]|uniref:Uncharacterized protein n=1 Tax=Caldimonas thermodepolymerans TaxID=215580 RepID=A0AA46DDR4_9BURK|nr:hypothetical protein [Caldimonas thermodepolymerans]TCP06580.1 hypothetical protein EV676_10663 [Caldimonas thermodepolymerans]UZG49363.1 hypothetical protein ONS87_07015 [Caldimonas thermodepolymerans]